MIRPVAALVFAFCCTVMAAAVAAAPALSPGSGEPAPALQLNDLEGRSIDLAAHRGKVVLVNFWATWCEPCRQEMPSIQRLQAKLAGKPFAVIAVNVDEPESRVRRFLRDAKLELPVAMDPNKTVTQQWGARLLPVTFIIGTDGRIRYRLVGDLDWSSETVVGVITQLMNGG